MLHWIKFKGNWYYKIYQSKDGFLQFSCLAFVESWKLDTKEVVKIISVSLYFFFWLISNAHKTVIGYCVKNKRKQIDINEVRKRCEVTGME